MCSSANLSDRVDAGPIGIHKFVLLVAELASLDFNGKYAKSRMQNQKIDFACCYWLSIYFRCCLSEPGETMNDSKFIGKLLLQSTIQCWLRRVAVILERTIRWKHTSHATFSLAIKIFKNDEVKSIY